MVIRRLFQHFLDGQRKTGTSDVTMRSVRLHNPDTLPATAQQLERQCILLKRTGNDLAAVWDGPGIVPAPPGPYRHRISVESRYLPSGLGSNGVLSVYTNEEDCTSGIAVFSQTARLAEHAGEYLYAHSARSLPPPDASGDLDTEAYTEQWMRNCPIYDDKDVVAVLGGWHFPWPDGDWEALRDRDLLVWTIEDAEPWVEVWQSDQGTEVIQRIT